MNGSSSSPTFCTWWLSQPQPSFRRLGLLLASAIVLQIVWNNLYLKSPPPPPADVDTSSPPPAPPPPPPPPPPVPTPSKDTPPSSTTTTTDVCAPVRSLPPTLRRVIRPGEDIYDDRGERVHAHGGGFLLPHQAGGAHDRWWWYGESAKEDASANVNAYSSADLVSWHFEGVALSRKSILGSLKASRKKDKKTTKTANKKKQSTEPPAVPGAEHLFKDTLNDPLQPTGNLSSARLIVERPKVVFHRHSSKYVMLFHLDHFAGADRPPPRYTWRVVGVAEAPQPSGPFTLVKVLRPDDQPSLDIQVTQLLGDGDDDGNSDSNVASSGGDDPLADPLAPAGSVFLTRSVDNAFVATSMMDPATDLRTVAPPLATLNAKKKKKKKKKGKDKGSGSVPLSRTSGDPPLEGVGVFRAGGEWYVMASLLRGWDPSPLELLKLGTGTNSSSSSLSPPPPPPLPAISLAAAGGVFAPSGLSPTGSKTTHRSQCSFIVPHCTRGGRRYFIYVGDRWNHGFDASLSSARYVMLPVVIRKKRSDGGGGVGAAGAAGAAGEFSGSRDGSSNNNDVEVLLPWRSEWDLDNPFPNGVGAFHRWMEEPPRKGPFLTPKEQAAARKKQVEQKAREKKEKHRRQKKELIQSIQKQQHDRKAKRAKLKEDQNLLRRVSRGEHVEAIDPEEEEDEKMMTTPRAVATTSIEPEKGDDDDAADDTGDDEDERITTPPLDLPGGVGVEGKQQQMAAEAPIVVKVSRIIN